jgi:polygalacturonase
MSLFRIPEYPIKQPLESTDDYVKRFRDRMQEEASERIKDFDILQLANVPWVDVRTHGATGDGTTDDTAAFTGAAIYGCRGRQLCHATICTTWKI